MPGHFYLIALGSNQRHQRLGAPRAVLAAAQAAIGRELGRVHAAAPVIESAPLGPSLRRYANGALVLESPLAPRALLAALLAVETQFGRRRRGQRWRARVLDCDIILWSGGAWQSGGRSVPLAIPHPAFASRAFVLTPARAIAPDWRDPVSGLTLAHLHARLTRRRPLPRGAPSLPTRGAKATSVDP